jgi:hypothetical protein
MRAGACSKRIRDWEGAWRRLGSPLYVARSETRGLPTLDDGATLIPKDHPRRWTLDGGGTMEMSRVICVLIGFIAGLGTAVVAAMSVIWREEAHDTKRG